MAQLQPVTGSIVGVETGTLRVGATLYSLKHLSSTNVSNSRDFGVKPAVFLGLLLAGLVVIQFGRNDLAESRGDIERYVTNSAGPRYIEAQKTHGKAVTEIEIGVLFLAAAGAIALMTWLTPNVHHLVLTFASGEQHRIDFTDRVACLAFRNQLSDAMRAAETPVIDARQVHTTHVHPPSTPHLR